MALTQNQTKALTAAADGRLKRTGTTRSNQRIYIDKKSGRPETVTRMTLDALVNKGLIKDLPKDGDPFDPMIYPITEKGKNEVAR